MFVIDDSESQCILSTWPLVSISSNSRASLTRLHSSTGCVKSTSSSLVFCTHVRSEVYVLAPPASLVRVATNVLIMPFSFASIANFVDSLAFELLLGRLRTTCSAFWFYCEEHNSDIACLLLQNQKTMVIQDVMILLAWDLYLSACSSSSTVDIS